MDFSIKASDLQKAMKLLSVTAKVNAVDMSGMILITANDDGTVEFLSNNGATALLYHSENVVIKVPGSVVIEYGKIRSFVTSFHVWNETSGVKDFSFESDDKSLKVSVVNTHENNKISEGELNLRTYDLYMVRQPKGPGKPSFVLNSSIFRTATSKVLYAITPSTSGMSFVDGMNVTFDEEGIYFVGTNSRMLSEYKVKNVSNLKEGSFLLRYDFIMGLRRALSEETPIDFEIDEREVKACFDDVCFWGKTIIGHEFPEYKHILGSFEHSIILDKDVLMSSLLPFSDILNPDDNYRLSFSIDSGEMLFFNDSASFKYSDSVDFDGKFIIDVNGLYMIQTIDTIKDDKIIIKFTDEDAVLIFDSSNFEDQKALITPIRRR
jgi:DNA polymerase III sliding clamp (beta) subunit (PCNA family)